MNKALTVLSLLVVLAPGAFAMNADELSSMKTQMLSSCEQSLSDRNQQESLQLSPEKIKSYCGCSADSLGQQLMSKDIETVSKWEKTQSPEFINIVEQSAQACQAKMK